MSAQMGTVIFLPTRTRRPDRRRLRPQVRLRRREDAAAAGDLVALADWRRRHERRPAQWAPQPPHDGDAS